MDPTGYLLERSADGATGWTQIADIAYPTKEFYDSGLAPSTTYYYRVKAYNASGSSGYSSTANATTDAQGVVVMIAGNTVGSGFSLFF